MDFFSSQAIKDQKQENAIFKGRLMVIILLVFIFFVTVMIRVYYLQTVKYHDFLDIAASNHIRLRSIAPERGLIYDSQGRLLASNIQSYALYVHPLKTEDVEELLRTFSSLIYLEPERLKDFKQTYSIMSRRSELVLLKEELTEEEIARLMVNKHRLAGMEIQPRYQRFYPYGELVSHLVGYTGRISPDEKESINKNDYLGFDEIGKIGAEKFFEQKLRGIAGLEEVGVNAYGDVVRTYVLERPHKGRDISLWLDVDLQKFVWETLGEDKGAIVVLDARGGGILAMASKPSYDNNQFVKGISEQEFSLLRNQKDAPLFNRATNGLYPPGSTVKPFYAIIALGNRVVTPSYTIFDKGWFRLQGSKQVFRNWKRSGHGQVDLLRALRVSSDTYFYNLAVLMGHDMMISGLEKFGFGRRSGLDIYGETSTPLPTNEWKIRKHHLPWFLGDTVNMGIGQGFFLATPLQLATATLVLANKGKDVRPRLVRLIDEAPYHTQVTLPQKIYAEDAHWDLVFQGLEEVLHHKEGTANRAGRDASYLIAGKTGTSQVVSLEKVQELKAQGREIKKEWQDHALFLGYAPSKEPRYIISLLLENGGSGSKAAVMARTIFDYLLLPKEEISEKN